MTLDRAIERSVEEPQPATPGTGVGVFYYPVTADNSGLAPWGTRRRGKQMRQWFYNPYNTTGPSAIVNVITRFNQLNHEISGGRNLANQSMRLLQNAQYGQGIDAFWSRAWLDYFTQDNGAFIEIVGAGAPDAPLRGRVMAINVLDSLRCYATGNPEFPVFYSSARTGKLHKIHYTRVRRLVDTPSPDPEHKGMGYCAMSRMFALMKQQMAMMQYNIEMLGGAPNPGFVTFSGVLEADIQKALREETNSANQERRLLYRKLPYLYSVDPSKPITVNMVEFMRKPEGMDNHQQVRDDSYLMALALGDDPTEIFPLTGQGLASGSQSKTMHAKSGSKVMGKMIILAERTFNLYIFPPPVELKYKPTDTEQSKAEAENAKLHSDIAAQQVSAGNWSPAIANEYMARTVPSFRDVLLDQAGNVRLPDDDVRTDDQQSGDVAPDGTAPPVMDDETPQAQRSLQQKDIQATRIDFEDDFEVVVDDIVNRRIDRATFGRRARAIVARGVRQAYLDGLEMEGVPRDQLSADDAAEINRITREQSVYVTNLGAAIQRYDPGSIPATLGNPQVWYNKSIAPAYYAGQRSGGRNSMKQWVMNPAKENCTTCKSLDGQIHRLRTFLDRGFYPKSSRLDCGGWRCGCEFVDASGESARGNLSRVKEHTHDHSHAA